ncbi:MAG: hypothetical protein HKN07_00255 [Acidimicrobiia bacterium]|nr:hypothetical protein [Acidimicrobiia bacterium]
MSPRSRTVLLAAGWALLVVGLCAVGFGVVTGSGAMLVAGLVASTLAWWLSVSLPEPDPAPHRTERRRREAIRRFSDHPVYVSSSHTKP